MVWSIRAKLWKETRRGQRTTFKKLVLLIWYERRLAETLFGYKGNAFTILKTARVNIGDQIRIIKGEEIYNGILMPRYELADQRHLVIKLKSGYNIGVEISSDMIIEKRKNGLTPTYTSSPIPKDKENLPTITIISTGGTIASKSRFLV